MEFRLPDVGEGLTEAVIVTWRVEVGQEIAVNDVLVEIETAKSLVELPSPEAGRVEALLVEEGVTVPVGTPIVSLATGASATASEGASATDGEPARGDAEPASREREPMLVGYGPSDAPVRRRRRRRPGDAPTAVSARAPGAPSPGDARHSPRVLAKPPVRKLAKDLGVDLAHVPHAGEVVTRSEVEAYAARGSETGTDGDDRAATVPVVGVRKATADAMVASAFSAPHVTVWRETDVSGTVDLLAKVRARHPDAPVTVLTLVAFAVCRALRSHRDLNASWRDDHIALHPQVDLGFAVASDRGLLVPHVPRADAMGLLELADALEAMKHKARSGRATPAELAGGTFTISNVGVFDVDGGTPILVPGQAGILATGRIVRKPWVVDDVVVPRHVMTLALSFDHRVVDGQQGARFLADVAALLSDPVLLAIG